MDEGTDLHRLGEVLQAAEKCKGWSKKCQGTTSVVPQAQQKNDGLDSLRKNAKVGARSVRARLQSCRKRHKKMMGFSPCGLLFV
jgi:hypothetical protein